MNIKNRIAEIIAQEAAAVASIKVTPEFEKAVLALLNFKGKY